MRAFEYRDFLVAVWWDPTPGFFTARAWEEFGRSTPPIQIQLPFYDRDFVSYVDRLSELNSNQLQYVGAKLFDSLFRGDILRLYLHLREQARPTESKIRIRLRIDPPIAARLPWECLYDTRHDNFVLNSDETTLVRYSEQANEPPPVPVRTPLRVLLAAVKLKGSGRAVRVANEAEAMGLGSKARNICSRGAPNSSSISGWTSSHGLDGTSSSNLLNSVIKTRGSSSGRVLAS